MFFELLKDVDTIGKNLTFLPPWGTMTSIIGSPSSWFEEEHSEFHLFKMDAFKVSLPTMMAMAINRTFPMRGNPCSIPRFNKGAFPEEAWFFVNGITTNIPILKRNGAFLEELFGRPIELMYNPTDGIVVDIVECLFGRTFDMFSEPADYVFDRILDALKNTTYKKVVLLGHSQGGIIVSNVVKKLLRENAPLEAIEKLEVYTFGSAADEFGINEELALDKDRLVPYIEHYANLQDLIAKVGVLQKRKVNLKKVDYYGEIYELDKEGHYLNAHYLPGFRDKKYISRRLGLESRLYGYLDGKKPTYFNPLPPRMVRAQEAENA